LINFATNNYTVIRIAKKIFVALLFIVAMAPIGAYIALQIPSMQTWAAKRAAVMLSKKLETKVSIGKVYYVFFNKLILNDVSILSSPSDTLLNCRKLSVSISARELITGRKLSFNRVHLYDGVFNLYNETDSTTNLSRVFKFKSSPKDTTDTLAMPLSLFAKEVKLKNFRFTLKNKFLDRGTNEGAINFANLSLSKIDAEIMGVKLERDTLYAEIRNISFNERSGFSIFKLNSYLKLSAREAHLENLYIYDGKTTLRANKFSLYYENSKAFSEFTDKVRMEADLNDSYLSFETLGKIAPSLSKNKLSMHLTGLISGTVSNLRSDNLKITSESGLTYVDLKARISGLPHVQETMAFIDISHCTTTSLDVAYIISSISGSRPIPFLTKMSPLIKYNFSGRLAGLLDDFVANGTIKSNIGSVYVDVLLKENEVKHGLHLQGKLRAENLNAGQLIQNTSLGELTFNSTMTALIRDESLGGSEFYIDSIYLKKLEFNGYPYSNLQATGSYVGNKFDGKIICHDPNLDFIFQGVFGLSTKKDSYYDFYADVIYANLKALNFDKRDSVSVISFKTLANFTQKTSGDIIGNIQVKNMGYTNSNGKYNIGDITILSNSNRDNFVVSLKSSFAEMNYRGSKFINKFAEKLLEATTARHIPNLGVSLKGESNSEKPEIYNLKLNFFDTRALSQLLLPGFFLSPNSSLNVSIDELMKVNIDFKAAKIGFKKDFSNNLNIKAVSGSEELNTTIYSDRIRLAGLDLDSSKILLKAINNNIGLKLFYTNNTKLKNLLRFSSDIGVEKVAGSSAPLFRISINPSELFFNNQQWNFASSSVSIHDSKFRFDGFKIFSDEQTLEVNGALSSSPEDSLSVKFKNLEIFPINYFIKKPFNISGKFTGTAVATNIYSEPQLLLNIEGKQVSVNNTPVGELNVTSKWDNFQKKFNIHLTNTLSGENPLVVTGTFRPKGSYLDLSAKANKTAVAYFEPFLSDIISKSSGTISGDLYLRGELDKLVLSGESGHLNDLGFTINFTKVPYILSGPFVIDDGVLKISGGTLKDRYGNTGRVNGGLSFKHFKTILFNTRVDFTNLECLNTLEKDNESFYGNAFATGNISIMGSLNKILMDISATSNRNTVIHIPLPTTSEASKTNLLTFVEAPDSAAVNYYDDYGYIEPIKEKLIRQASELDVKLRIRVNTDAQMLIEVDKSVGDVIKSYGSGLIDLEINPTKDIFSVHGDYLVNRGLYTFVLQGIFKRDFNLQEGGNIYFNGDILKTRLNLTAIYNTKASVNTLIADTSSVSNRRNVNCSIRMEGDLLNPRLSFGIDIPDIDPSTKARVDAALNTEDKVVKQVMSILVSGSFIPDIQSSIVNNSTLLYSNATEVLSNQINNIFNQLNIPLDFSFNYQPGQNGRDIFDAAISAQLFDNRVIVNGNIGSAKFLNQNSDVVGDIDVEVKLDEKGRFRAKAFSHSADQYSNYLDNSQRSGVGLVYQEEFSSFRELFNRFFLSKKRRELKALQRKAEKEAILTEKKKIK